MDPGELDRFAMRKSMTLPDERYRSIERACLFLQQLCNSQVTPRVPKYVREEARSILRHYPNYYDLQQLSDSAPHIVQERMEPLHRMIAAYEDLTPEKNNDRSE